MIFDKNTANAITRTKSRKENSDSYGALSAPSVGSTLRFQKTE